MTKHFALLILDDDAQTAQMLKSFLEISGEFQVDMIDRACDLWLTLENKQFDLLLLDLRLADGYGLDILKEMREKGYRFPVIMMTGQGSEQIAVEAMQSGAVDYLVKGAFVLENLPPTIRNAIRIHQLELKAEAEAEKASYQSRLLDNIRDAVVVWDSNGVINFWNTAAQILYGRKANDLVGKSVEDHFLALFTPCATLESLKQGTVLEFDRSFRNEDNEIIWINTKITPILDSASRSVIGYMDVSRNITRQKQEQQALKESRGFIEHILNTSPDIIFIINLADHRAVYVNPQAMKLLMFTPTELMSIRNREDTASILYEEDLPGVINFYKQVAMAQDGDMLEFDFRIRRRDGEVRWLSTRNSIFQRNAEGRPTQVICSAQDVTERKNYEMRLIESEARYRAIVDDHQTELICRFLPDTTLTFVNDAYCRYFQKSRQDLIGTKYINLVAKIDRDRVMETFGNLTINNPVSSYTHRVIMSNGEIRWHEWTDRAIYNESGKLLEYQSVGRDITERIKMEEQVKTAQTHLAQAARMSSIGMLASSVAHQINNPLTTIIAESQMLMHEIGEDHPARNSIKAIDIAGWRAHEVVQNLLEFSREPSPSEGPSSVNDTIKQAVTLIGEYLYSSDITLDLELNPNIPHTRISVQELEDLWINFLVFLQSFPPPNTTHCIKISTAPQETSSIAVQISDNQLRIQPDQMDTIFEPHLIPPGEGRGSGLELTLCREIVFQNGGNIIINSDDLWTSFLIILPAEG